VNWWQERGEELESAPRQGPDQERPEHNLRYLQNSSKDVHFPSSVPHMSRHCVPDKQEHTFTQGTLDTS
jgi:hypothetical protein